MISSLILSNIKKIWNPKVELLEIKARQVSNLLTCHVETLVKTEKAGLPIVVQKWTKLGVILKRAGLNFPLRGKVYDST